MADAQGPELRALAKEMRSIARRQRSGPVAFSVSAAQAETIISALDRAAAAEGEKAEAWDKGWKAAQSDVWNRKDEGTYRITPNPYRSAS